MNQAKTKKATKRNKIHKNEIIINDDDVDRSIMHFPAKLSGSKRRTTLKSSNVSSTDSKTLSFGRRKKDRK